MKMVFTALQFFIQQPFLLLLEFFFHRYLFLFTNNFSYESIKAVE